MRLAAARILFASGLAFAVFLSDGTQTPAFGQDAATVADINEAWPRLPDGRVVFTIYGVRLAVPTCDDCLRTFEFWSIGVGSVPMRTAIAEPRRLREMIAASTRMSLTMGNTWDPRGSRVPFLGKFDSHSLPRSTRIDLDVFKHEKPRECWRNIPECELLHTTATQSQAPGPDGFYVLPGPVALPSPGHHYMTDTGSTLLVAPLDEAHDAVGLPLYIYCPPLPLCDNSGHNGPPAFALRPNVDLYFQFLENDYARSELKAMHARMVKAVESVLMDDLNPEQKQ